MRLLLIGRTGQVATEILRRAGDVTVTALGREVADLSHPEAAADVVRRADVDAVINAAAWTAVDAAEAEGRAACWAVNVTGTANLVAAARRNRLPLVYVSSDYVFDGTRDTHAEDEPFSPLSAYGASKAAADALDQEALHG